MLFLELVWLFRNFKYNMCHFNGGEAKSRIFSQQNGSKDRKTKNIYFDLYGLIEKAIIIIMNRKILSSFFKSNFEKNLD